MAIITVTSTKDSGTGSLREAIANASDGDKLVFSSDLANKTIRLDKELLVDKSLTIDGSDAPNLTISGENKTRILRVDYSYTDVEVRDLTLANGKAVDNKPDTNPQGGAIKVSDSNTLTVDNVDFKNNVSERGGAIFVGYGSSATIENSTFDGNDGSVANDGFSAGAISTYGGGEGAKVVNSNGLRDVGGNASLDIRDTTFTNNKGTYGAVYTLHTNLTVKDSVFKSNEGTNGSGAVFTDGANGTSKRDDLGGTTLISNVTAKDNVGGGEYGGAFFFSGYSKDKVVIENSQITNNKGYRGAGVAVQSYRDEENPVSLEIENTTIANNTASSQGGGLWADAKGGVDIEDSEFSGNRVTNSKGDGQIGGAIVLNTPEEAKSTIDHTKFANNYADVQAGNIWIAGKEQAKNLTISNSEFAGNRSPKRGGESERTVNFKVNDGGGNVVQNTNGADEAIAGAKLTKNLQIDPVSSNKDGGDSVVSPATNNPPTGSPVNVSSTKIKNDPLHYEAEELNLTGYKVETIKGSDASGGKQISLKETGNNQGAATGTFQGKAGTYQVKVGYYDEDDGQSQAKISVGDKTTNFNFDRDLPGYWAQPTTKTSRIAIEEVQLNPGDTFKIEGSTDKTEFARFDDIEFIPIKDAKAEVINNVKDGIIGEVVDLRDVDFDANGKTDEKVSFTVDNITNAASISNSAGFYKVLDSDGTVLDELTNQLIRPGEKGYETAALNQRVSELEFNADGSSFTAEVDGGIFLAPYLISDGTVEEFIDKNPTNDIGDDGSRLHAYFAFENANPDKQQHLKSLDDSFGFEDSYGGGDQDFRDLTFKVHLASA